MAGQELASAECGAEWPGQGRKPLAHFCLLLSPLQGPPYIRSALPRWPPCTSGHTKLISSCHCLLLLVPHPEFPSFVYEKLIFRFLLSCLQTFPNPQPSLLFPSKVSCLHHLQGNDLDCIFPCAFMICISHPQVSTSEPIKDCAQLLTVVSQDQSMVALRKWQRAWIREPVPSVSLSWGVWSFYRMCALP